jgi:hypothetical protein
VGRDGIAMVWATQRIWRNVRKAAAASSETPAAGEVFDDANAELLMDADQDHWWFRSKAAFVSTAQRSVTRVPAFLRRASTTRGRRTDA